MRTLANSGDPDEMLHNAAIHQGLHCLLRYKRSSKNEIQYCLEIITCVHLGDNCIQNFHLRRYIVGYTVRNFVLRRRTDAPVER